MGDSLPFVGSALAGIGGAAFGSNAQGNAGKRAEDIINSIYGDTKNNLMPFINTGTKAAGSLDFLTGAGSKNPLMSPLLRAPGMNFNEAELEATPGYQFNLTQGLKSVQNSAAARGLGSSGAALKGASTFATGLADSTYQNQFNNAVTNQSNQFNRLLSLANLGSTSASNLGSIGQGTGNSLASIVTGVGNAYAAAGNQAAGSVSNSLMMPAMLAALA